MRTSTTSLAKVGARAMRPAARALRRPCVRRQGAGVQGRADVSGDISNKVPAEFYPYSSKYDAWLRHEASLSAGELRGLAAFNDPAKGNCARCHPSGPAQRRISAIHGFRLCGRSARRATRSIPANTDPRYFDLGLCGPLRTDLADKNGILRPVPHPLAAQRGDPARVLPQRRVPSAGRGGALLCRAGHAAAEVVFARGERRHEKFDDLPAAYRAMSTPSLPLAGMRATLPR